MEEEEATIADLFRADLLFGAIQIRSFRGRN